MSRCGDALAVTDMEHGCLSGRDCCSGTCDLRNPRKLCCLAEGAVCGTSSLKHCCRGLTCTYIQGARMTGVSYCRAYST